MFSERLLAKVRQSVGYSDADVDVERICCSGFLSQVMTEHSQRGGADPRAPTRTQLLEDGVHLRRRRDLKSSKPRSAFVNWMCKQEADRKSKKIKLDKEQYHTWQLEKRNEFFELSRDRLLIEEGEAKEAHDAKMSAVEEASESFRALKPASAIESIIGLIGDVRTPYRAAAFDARIRRKLGMATDAKAPGFT
eukprot:5665869-Pyramimonas_sp.AAC.1